MKKRTISDNPFGVALDLHNQAIDAAKFIVRHPSCVLGDDVFNAIKSSVKMTVSSAFADIYLKVVESGSWSSLFTLLDLSDEEDSIPTIFTLDDITIDGKYVSENVPKSYQNVWLNLTPILGKRDSREAYNGFLPIKDSPRLASLISRGVMCMSYNDSDQWLNASMGEVVLDTYSFIMTSPFRMMFNLDLESEKLMRTLFAAYMAQELSNKYEEVPSLLFRCQKWLGAPSDIQTRFEKMGEERNKLERELHLQPNELTVDVCCALMAKYGPERMKKLTSSNLVRFMSRSAMDRNATIMSIYYPPFFVHSLLASMGGTKNPIFSNVLKFSDTKRKVIKFADDLVQSGILLGNIDR